MINFLSTWAEQIVLAVVISTIIELILPNNKNKKYIQMILGIYILFNIISPIIKNKEVISIEDYTKIASDIEENTTIDQSSMDKRLEIIYLNELENDIKNKFSSNGIQVIECKVDAELNTNKKNAGIHLIKVKIKAPEDENKLEEIKNQIITEYEITEDRRSKMFKDFLKNTGEEKDKKRQIENIVVFIIILIITVLIINNMWSKDNGRNNTTTGNKVLAEYSITESTNQNNLENKLEDILESINGVGKTKVLIKYDENVPENEKVVMPVIEGAIITAEGASNASTKSAIISAVEAVTGLAVHKIQVFEMGE